MMPEGQRLRARVRGGPPLQFPCSLPLLFVLAALLCVAHARTPRPPRAAAAAALPALPSWARMEPMATTWERNASLAHNRDLVAKSNATGTVYDIVFMGDSLTSLTVWGAGNAAEWESWWGPMTGLNAARLGVGGTTVEELTWRLLANGERLAFAPRLVVLLVGTNNVLSTNPWDKLDFLLNQWFATAYPATRILVVAPLPSFADKAATLTRRYKPVVARCAQCTFSTCGSKLDWTNSTLFTDGLHLTPLGYKYLYGCIKPVALSLLASKRP